MKKPIIAFAVLLVAAGASVGAFLAVKNKKDKEDKASSQIIEDNKLVEIDPDSITKVDFQCEDGLYTAEYNEETKKWSLTNRSDFPLDQLYLQYVCNYSATLTAETNYGEATDEAKALYGLDDPQSVTLYSGDTTHTIYVGDISPTNDFYYVMVDDRNTIYAVDSMYSSAFKSSRLLLKNKELLPYDPYTISQLSVIKNGETTCELTFDADAQTWSLPQEYSQIVFDQTAVTPIINNITSIEAEELLDEDLQDLSKYGFDAPDAEVVVKGTDGTERKFLVSLFDDNPTYSYVLIEDDNQVELYYTADLSFIDNTAYDYIVQNIQSAELYNISGFELTFGGNTDTCTVNMQESTCQMNGNTVDFSDSSIYTAFQNFFSSFNTLRLTSLDMDAKPELTDPILTVVYHFADTDDLKVDLVSDGADSYYVFRNGVYSGEVAGNELDGSRTSLAEMRNSFFSLAGLE